MAGFFVFSGPSDRIRLEAAAGRLRFFDEEIRLISGMNFSAAWIGHDDPKLFAPALDRRTGVCVLTSGRVSWDEHEWRAGEKLEEFEGGVSNRILLRNYLEGGGRAVALHNGPSALVVWDPRCQTIHLWTDQMGYHPVFCYRPDDHAALVIASSADAIAEDAFVSVSRDLVAAAEFLSAWRVTPPHTYWNEIKYAGAATHYLWDIGENTYRKEVYWKPFDTEPFSTLDEAVASLSEAVREAIRIRTLPRLGPVVSFTSGGLDSRVVLFSAASPEDLLGLNLYDVPNKESDVAHRLCDAAGVRYVGFGRDVDYYPRTLQMGALLSGAMWSQEDSHYLGVREFVAELGARTVMTSCTTDWLFKGYGLERRYLQILGRNLPIHKLTDSRVDGFLPNLPRRAPIEFAKLVADRLEEWFEGTPRSLKADADWLAVEDRRVRPACYAVSVSGQIMYRVFPYDTFLADQRVAECYSRSRAEWKVNADLWGLAAKRICASGRAIEDANFGWKAGSSTPMKVAAFAAGYLRRRVRRTPRRARGLATEGSWPNFGWYIENSATLKRLWWSIPRDTRDMVSSVWGSNPWEIPLSTWADVPNDLMRVLTLALYWDGRGSARRAV